MVPASDPSDLGVTSYTKLSEGNFNTQIHIVTGPLCRHIQNSTWTGKRKEINFQEC